MSPRKKQDAMKVSPEDGGGPVRLPLLPLRDIVLFPRAAAPIIVGRDASLAALSEALEGDRLLLVVTQRDRGLEEVGPNDLYQVGCLARVMQGMKLPDGTMRVVLEGLERARLIEVVAINDHLEALAELIETETESRPAELELEIEAQYRAMVDAFATLANSGAGLQPESLVSVMNAQDAGHAADLIAFYLPVEEEPKQRLLETLQVPRRLAMTLSLLERERQISEAMQRVNQRVRQEIDDHQREMFLREQLSAIKEELGEGRGWSGELDELREKLEGAKLPAEAREKSEREANRLETLAPMSPEYSVAITYLEWLANMPWSKYTRDRLSIEKANQILEEDHYGLAKAKERILEYLAVRKLNKQLHGPILCFVGPPGTGKTSLGRSIARTMGRKFIRISLGGVRDEAEIRGHRRTYVGALPGKIIQGLRNVDSANPIFMIDEIDKLGADFRGDPASALLEVLDPEQNNSFRDHYLEVPFDLSRVMFIATANDLENLPPALLDRMEVIEFEGYTELDKLQIAYKYLIPRQLEANGLKKRPLEFEKTALQVLVREYTREAGVRNLNRQIGSVCRKLAKQIASGQKPPKQVTGKLVKQLLGLPPFLSESQLREGENGVAMGLAWTEVGGDLLPIEVNLAPGKGELKLTGSLGLVMKESAEAATSYVRSLVEPLGLEPELFEKHSIHIHVPAGAVPKDGPSAGITLATALLSALAKRASAASPGDDWRDNAAW